MQPVLESLVNTEQAIPIGMHEAKGRCVLSVSQQVRGLLVGGHSADTAVCTV